MAADDLRDTAPDLATQPPLRWRGTLGELGGMGPLAGASFVYRLTQLTPVLCDQAHLPVLLRNDPRIPDRSQAHLDGGADPFPAMQEGARFLDREGAACIAIPCNTAHLWFDRLQASVSAPILHIVDAVVADLARQGVRGGKVGVMGTAATLASGLYQSRLIAAGYEPVLLTPDEQRNCSTAAIDAVKGNRPDKALAPATAGIEALARRSARAVVLGCTELPLAVPHALRAAFGLVLTDSIDALALAVIARMQLPAFKPPVAINAMNAVAATPAEARIAGIGA
ncbi:MAG: amino acid racemase [Pseudomonadota bacterium]